MSRLNPGRTLSLGGAPPGWGSGGQDGGSASKVPARWLPRDELERLDAKLVRLGRGVGALRLKLAEALEALDQRGGHHRLGFSSLGAYVEERCERTRRWCSDARALARKLERLPALRRALVRGEISWSVAELLARHAAEPEDEGELLELARGATVRQLRLQLARRAAAAQGLVGDEAAVDVRASDAAEDEEEEPRCTLQLTVERDIAVDRAAGHGEWGGPGSG